MLIYLFIFVTTTLSTSKGSSNFHICERTRAYQAYKVTSVRIYGSAGDVRRAGITCWCDVATQSGRRTQISGRLTSYDFRCERIAVKADIYNVDFSWCHGQYGNASVSLPISDIASSVRITYTAYGTTTSTTTGAFTATIAFVGEKAFVVTCNQEAAKVTPGVNKDNPEPTTPGGGTAVTPRDGKTPEHRETRCYTAVSIIVPAVLGCIVVLCICMISVLCYERRKKKSPHNSPEHGNTHTHEIPDIMKRQDHVTAFGLQQERTPDVRGHTSQLNYDRPDLDNHGYATLEANHYDETEDHSYRVL